MQAQRRIIRTPEELIALKVDWQTLYAKIPENTIVFSSWEYIFSYVQFYHPHNWFVVATYGAEDRQLTGIFPLTIEAVTVAGITARVCKPLGISFVTYIDWLVAPSNRVEAINLMLATLRDEFACDGLLFGPVHEDSKNYLLLLESARPEDRRLFYRPNQPYIDTRTVAFERFSRGKKKSTLSDARRCIRRLSELGKLEFSIDSPDVDLMENVQILCRQQSKRFAGQHVFSATENWNGFLPELAMRGVTGGVNELATLRLNGELIASHLGFLCKGRRHYYFPGHVVEYLKYSPAKVLMLFLIEQTFKERGVFCFGSGAYDYKADWSQAIAEVKLMWIFFTQRGRTLLRQHVNPPAAYSRSS